MTNNLNRHPPARRPAPIPTANECKVSGLTLDRVCRCGCKKRIGPSIHIAKRAFLLIVPSSLFLKISHQLMIKLAILKPTFSIFQASEMNGCHVCVRHVRPAALFCHDTRVLRRREVGQHADHLLSISRTERTSTETMEDRERGREGEGSRSILLILFARQLHDEQLSNRTDGRT